MLPGMRGYFPLESHSVWYSSQYGGSIPPPMHPWYPGGGASFGSAPQQQTRRRHGHQHAPAQSRLARLQAGEAQLERRRTQIQSFGSTWLRPPGVSKTLHQMREEKREQDEHTEALRREQLVQEMAEAEAAGGAGLGPGPGQGAGPAGNPDIGIMSDAQLDGMQDLDADIPDASFANYDDNEDDEDEEDEDEDEDEGEDDVEADEEEEAEEDEAEEDDDEEEEEEEAAGVYDDETRREQRRNEVLAAHRRLDGGAYRESLGAEDEMYGGADAEDDEDEGELLDEDDVLNGTFHSLGPEDQTTGSAAVADNHHDYDGTGMNMDVDLDNDVPHAGAGYEHTDSEADQSSEMEEDEDDGMDMPMLPVGSRRVVGPPQSPTMRSRGLRNGGAPRSSMDLSSLLRDESSFLDGSPSGPTGGRRL